ncbi:hypothetical protein A2818_00170 [Candidatus Nomurabacteria bacterium RIFCSPHIGHO2_01_FULL_40_12]|uniref:Uncharacterized protein n=1 Tax=Candidatus Nomurabacteria bacterium RIFCSPHIGHO2_01_FULL_40_12 TaxID=1801737 RepID=A0A1F6V0R7_9BACT|nr:MAG: hypothetical protein A2818_00170 [Candidatus Nomurabacteria bacterium RIFCSPHIGHO2_01_FULL_40_12]
MKTGNMTIKFISVLLVISILMPAVLFAKPQKAEAFWFATWLTDVGTTTTAVSTTAGTGVNTASLGLQIKDFAKEIGKQILMHIAAKLLQDMTKSTLNWINTGYWGNPLFVENPKSFFKDIAKYEIKILVDIFGYDSRLYPFGKDFALNAIYSYKRKLSDNAQYSLNQLFTDPILQRNYINDFNVGGWYGFMTNTQYPQNNYFGFQMLATEALADRLNGIAQNNIEKVNKALDQGMGFLSPQTCADNGGANEYNRSLTNQFKRPSYKSTVIYKFEPTVSNTGNDAEEYERQKAAYDQKYEEFRAADQAAWTRNNTCKNLVSTTPGSVVGNTVMSALASGQRLTELGATMGNSISALVDALLNKFTQKGLNALASKVNQLPPKDDWSYYGQTLGSPVDGSNTAWDAGPDEVVILNDFKQTVEDGINNTNTEIDLMNEIAQLISQIWPKARELDICIPGPNMGWQERLAEEMSRNSKELQGKLNDDDGKKSAQADLAFRELKFAVNFFKDWIKNKMMTELPNSIIYLDAVDEIKDLSQQSEELTDKKRLKTQALARLKAIQTALSDTDRFSTQPVPGSNTEKVLISLKKQYNATRDAISNTATIEDTRNELAVAQDKLNKLNALLNNPLNDPSPGCLAERKAKGWTSPSLSGQGSSYRDQGTEQNLFCDFPIQGGYDHESFRHANDNGNGKGVTHPEVPYVNAKDVLKWARWGGIFGNYTADINMNCNIIYKANILDYKGNIPGTTNLTEPYIPLPDEPGEEEGGGGEDEGGGGENGTPPHPNYANPPGVCATDDEIAGFLENNPDDSYRLPSAFPCN